jgi:protein-S-isoprenylcysteine O-methyltransferase Ste14
MAIKALHRTGWVMIALGVLLPILFVTGLTHSVSAQVPSTVSTYDSHHRWVIVGFAVSLVGAVLLVVTEMFRRTRKIEVTKPSTDLRE